MSIKYFSHPHFFKMLKSSICYIYISNNLNVQLLLHLCQHSSEGNVFLCSGCTKVQTKLITWGPFSDLDQTFLQVSGRPVERLQHQTPLGRCPAPQPPPERLGLRGLQLSAAGQLDKGGNAPSAALQTRRPL